MHLGVGQSARESNFYYNLHILTLLDMSSLSFQLLVSYVELKMQMHKEIKIERETQLTYRRGSHQLGDDVDRHREDDRAVVLC